MNESVWTEKMFKEWVKNIAKIVLFYDILIN